MRVLIGHWLSLPGCEGAAGTRAASGAWQACAATRHRTTTCRAITVLGVLVFVTCCARLAAGQENWLQFKYDQHHSGEVAGRSVPATLGLVGTVPLTDAIFTAPVVADGRVHVVDGSGVAWALDAMTLKVIWRYDSRGGEENCHCVSSPAIVGPYLHFGTGAGSYCVLDRSNGNLVREIRCGGPVFTSPVVANGRAYFATLGARVFAVEPNGDIAWSWDFVKELMGFDGDRWSGQAWLQHKGSRVTWRDHFCCSRNLAVHENTVVVPAGGRVVFLEDQGSQAKLRTVGEIPSFAGSEYPASFGLSMAPSGDVYVQWHRRDNAGRVEILRLREDDTLETSFVPGTQTAINLPGLLSFSSVSLRGPDVYRCRPELGFGFCKHSPQQSVPQQLGGYPSICPPILLKDHGVYGGLDGRLYVVPLSGQGETRSFATAFGRAISAPVAVCDGRIYFGCEDGYLYVLGPDGDATLPDTDLDLDRIRSPMTGNRTAPEHDWYTNFGDQQNRNANDQGIRQPVKIKWLRRYQGTFKHLPVCGGGRMYTHSAEGQVFAVEQETGRLLWRRYWPEVYLSFTSPIYFRHNGSERLLVPQAGMDRSRMRCLDAASGQLLWEAAFSGSPSWSRQAPPIVHRNLAIYASGSGRYAPQGTDKAFVMKGDPQPSGGSEVMSWIYTHNNPYYPKDNRPLIWAWDIDTGRLVWQKDFSAYGAGGNDCGLCLMDGKLYYSTFFGYSADQRRRRGLPGGPNGITAELDPMTGNVGWLTTQHYVTAGCTISASEGRLYVGGYNQPDQRTSDRFVFCLEAKDGGLVWQSDPVASAVNVITLGPDRIFSNASGQDGHVLDYQSGHILSRFNMGYACTRFSCSGPYVMGANMDMIDLSDGNRLVSTGPCVDSRECVGATVSNGRIFYTSQASGLQVCQVAGDEAEVCCSPWQATP